DRIGRIEEIVGNIRKYEPREETKKIISPSQFFSSGDRNAFHGRGHIPILKGKAVHGLLEILPKVDPSHWHRISETYIDSAFSDLSVTDREEVREIVPSLLKNENFREFFQGNSRAEVSILGEVDGLKISGKIDRMIEFDDRVVLLDYKNTSRMFKGVDDLPEEYVKQLELYRKLVKKLNPSKTIECYILTTVHGDLFKVF
ncbi:MAG: PD-(D/E)XK nuclease family protein, partial [Rickettsiales bacterium]|nr:PD-(D/E)XK nuclease family protein [Rickettsiales bacterium]